MMQTKSKTRHWWENIVNRIGTKHSPIFSISLIAVLFLNSCSILNHCSMVTYNQSIAKAPFDVVIVPGLPYDSAKLNPIFKARLLWAKELYENGTARNLIFSGSAVHNPYIEAAVMKMMADSLGIPAQHTFVEDKALHSNENVAYGIAFAHKMNFKNIAVATDPIQTYVIKKYIREHHEHVALLPFNLKSMPHYYKATVPNINAEKAFVENFIPLKGRENEFTPIQD